MLRPRFLPRPATGRSATLARATLAPVIRPKLLAVSVAACFGLGSVAALANPSGASVVSGSASFATSGSQLTITNSPNAIINWQSFSIGVNEVTRFIQQNAASAVLNRVVGSGGVIPQSVIDGILSSNGRVFLMNNSGVVFGPNARIDVAGLIASSLNMSNEDFLAGRMRFTEVLGAGGISNTGLIETPSGGRVFLVAPDVKNSGIIRAPQGEIVLAAGKSVELVTEGSPYVTVKVTNSDTEQALNMGSLVSQGGRISMGAALVRNTGVIEAGGAVVGDGGVIRLVGTKDVTLAAGSRTSVTGGSTSGNAGKVTIQSETGTTLVYGAVDATAAAGKGGTVQALGVRVGVLGSGVIDASGDTGGGTVLIGGDYQGGNAAVQNAQNTEVGINGVIRADAGTSGDGGRVIVWSDGDTRVAGRVSTRGGSQSGNGGFIETSGKLVLNLADSRIDTRAPNGRWGTWLLDPTDYTILAGDETNFNNTGSAIITASNNITFGTSLSLNYTGGTGSFTVTAGNDVDMANYSISAPGNPVNVTLTATGGGILNGGNIATAGGNVNLSAGGSAGIALGNINTTGAIGGSIVLSGYGVNVGNLNTQIGDVGVYGGPGGVLGNNITTSGGAVYVSSGSGNVSLVGINTTAQVIDNVASGDVAILATSGDIHTHAITTRSDNPIMAAGGVTLTAATGNVDVEGNIDAVGPIFANVVMQGVQIDVHGSIATKGRVELQANNTITVGIPGPASITTGGGSVLLDGPGGVTVGGINTSSGVQYLNYGPDDTSGVFIFSQTGAIETGPIITKSYSPARPGGNVLIQTNSGTITVAGSINTSGADGVVSNFYYGGSSGGNVTLIRSDTITTPGVAVSVGDIIVYGGNGSTSLANEIGGSGGWAGEVLIYGGGGFPTPAYGSISTGNILAWGGNGGDGGFSFAGGEGGKGGWIRISTANNLGTGNIDNYGGNGGNGLGTGSGSNGGTGDAVDLRSLNGSVTTGSITSFGGDGGNGGTGTFFLPIPGGEGSGGGTVSIASAGPVSTGAINTRGGKGGDGGEGGSGGLGGDGGWVVITNASGTIGVASILSAGGNGGNGGTAGNFYSDGGNGGHGGGGGGVYILGDVITVTGGIDGRGGNAGMAGNGTATMAGGNGGDGGIAFAFTGGSVAQLSLQATSSLSVGSINARGGDGTNAGADNGAGSGMGGWGGDGGYVTLAAGTTVSITGSIDTRGGRGGNSVYYGGGSGGWAGWIDISAGTGVSINGNVLAYGGTGGKGGDITISNTDGPGGDGGDGGDVGISTTGGDILIVGGIDGRGGRGGDGGNGIDGGGDNGGHGGSGFGSSTTGMLYLQANGGTVAVGGPIVGVGGDGGLAGSDGTTLGFGGAGGSGGSIEISGAVVSIPGPIVSSGGRSQDASSLGAFGMNAGDAGSITITQNNGNGVIGDVTANGGIGGSVPVGSGNNGGAGGDAGFVSLSGFSTLGNVSAVGGMATGGGAGGATGGTAGQVNINNQGPVSVASVSSYAGRNANNTYYFDGGVYIGASGNVNVTGPVITRTLVIDTDVSALGQPANVVVANAANQVDSAHISGYYYGGSFAQMQGNIDYLSRGFTQTPTGSFNASGTLNFANPTPAGGIILNGSWSNGTLYSGLGVSAGAGINLLTDNAGITIGPLASTGGTFQWTTVTPSTPIALANSFLSQISAPMVKIGSKAQTGGIYVMDTLAPASVGTLSLISGGQIATNFGAAYGVSVGALNADGSSVILPGPNNVGTLQGRATAGDFYFGNNGDITLGVADPGNGIPGIDATGMIVLSSVNGSILSGVTGTDALKSSTGVQLDALNGSLGTASTPLSIATLDFTGFAANGIHATFNQYAPQFMQFQTVQNTTSGDIALKLYGGGQFSYLIDNKAIGGNVGVQTFSPLAVLGGIASGGNIALATSGAGGNNMALGGTFTTGPGGTFAVTVGIGGQFSTLPGYNGNPTVTTLTDPKAITSAILSSPAISQIIDVTTTKEIVQTIGMTTKTESQQQQEERKKEQQKQGAGKC